MEIEELKSKVAAILREELAGRPYRAFFFGSRVTGTAGPRADLDAGIEGAAPVPTELMRSIRARVDALRTLYTVDVVDFALLSDDFKQVAKTKIEEITTTFWNLIFVLKLGYTNPNSSY